MTRNNQVSEDYSSMQFARLANLFDGIPSGGPFWKGGFAPAELFRFRIVCFIESCRITSKLWPFIISAANRAVGGTV